jgi:PTH1 family peptidyl-tRNA hydrolase
MNLIVGLGNPGSQYEDTRHNIGFMVIDSLLKELLPADVSKKSFNSILYKKNDLLLMKPQSFMNVSGEPILRVSSFYKCKKIIVIHDDIELEFGAIKYKLGGGNGGHNGLKSIDSIIGNSYYRARIGVSKPEIKNQISDYVLHKFTTKENKYICDIVDSVKMGVLALLNEDLSIVSSKHTKKKICLD